MKIFQDNVDKPPVLKCSNYISNTVTTTLSFTVFSWSWIYGRFLKFIIDLEALEKSNSVDNLSWRDSRPSTLRRADLAWSLTSSASFWKVVISSQWKTGKENKAMEMKVSVS